MHILSDTSSGARRYELDQNEVFYLGQLVEALNYSGLNAGKDAGWLLAILRPLSTHAASLAYIAPQLVDLKTRIDALAADPSIPAAPPTHTKELAELRDELAALNQRFNELAPNYGKF